MSYVLNAWYVGAWAHEVERPVGVRILNEPIVIWRTAAGALVAFDDRCVHRLAPLSLGRCEGEQLRCMYHGLLYDPAGRVVEIPGQERIGARMRVRTYPVIEKHSWIWIWMGDAEAADEALIPPVIGMDRPNYIFGHGQIDYSAEARLINDNLLDFSHLSFLHIKSVPLSETWARERPNVTQHERHIRTERWIRSEGVSGTLNAEGPVDTYHYYDFFVPGVLLMMARAYPVGTADTLNGQRPDTTQEPRGFTTQAITPLTDRTARYFYIMASRRCEDGTVFDVAGRRRQGGEAALDMASAEKAFAEDKIMIEAQQRNIDITSGWCFTPTTADRGVILFNQLVERLVRQESSSSSTLSPKVSPIPL